MCIHKLIMQCWSMITQNFLTLNVGAIKGSDSRYPEPSSESINAAECKENITNSLPACSHPMRMMTYCT